MKGLIDIKGYKVIHDWKEYSGLAIEDTVIDKITRDDFTYIDAHFLTVSVLDRNGQYEVLEDFADMFTFVLSKEE